MKTIVTIFLLGIICAFPCQLIAQGYGNYKKVPLAVGLFPPVSTNGTNAGNCVNQLSLNLFSGYSAGLSGLEFAGFSNTERDFVRGIQFAGFGNYVNGEFTGFQFAGFGNFNRGISNGFQVSGFSNFNYDQADGVLAAGFFNFTRGKSLAIQLAGFGNFCEDVEGLQASGFCNLVKGNGKVIQLAGFANIAQGNVHGVQASGFLNFANNLNGIQIGIINICDTLENGIPIGILSVVKNGFREFELSFSEGLNTQIAYKIGVHKFYNIFAIGGQFLSGDYKWAIGYGIGTHLINDKQFKTQLEFMSYHINSGRIWSGHYNGFQQVKLTFVKSVSERLGVFIGPSINLLVKDNDEFENSFAPYSLYSYTGKRTILKGWIGITAGIHFN